MSEEIRTEAEQANDPRSGSYIHPEMLQMHHADPDRKLPRWFWIMLAVMLLAIAGMSLARYAWAADRPYVITLTYHGKDYDQVQRTSFVLGQPAVVYESKVACDIAITRVRVHLSGARLQCNPQR